MNLWFLSLHSIIWDLGGEKAGDADNETSKLWSCEPAVFQVVTVNLGLTQMF